MSEETRRDLRMIEATIDQMDLADFPPLFDGDGEELRMHQARGRREWSWDVQRAALKLYVEAASIAAPKSSRVRRIEELLEADRLQVSLLRVPYVHFAESYRNQDGRGATIEGWDAFLKDATESILNSAELVRLIVQMVFEYPADKWLNTRLKFTKGLIALWRLGR